MHDYFKFICIYYYFFFIYLEKNYCVYMYNYSIIIQLSIILKDIICLTYTKKKKQFISCFKFKNDFSIFHN